MERIDFTLSLVAETPVHVGGAGPDRLVDLPLANDGQGRLLVPGSSWAGVLRTLAARLPDVDPATLFGPPPQVDGRASLLTVADTTLARDVGIDLRTGVGIDRRRGAAARGIVYDRLLLPAGTRLELAVRYDGPDGADARALVAAVRARGLRIGAATSRGLGRLRCARATARAVDLDSRASLLTAMSGTVSPKPIEPAANPPCDPVFVLGWRPLRPVVVGGPSPGETADLVPLLARTADGMVPVLPGSSIKGVLRASVERVVRTVLELEEPADAFVTAQAELVERVPALGLLFGSADRAGVLSVPDTTAAVPAVGGNAWRDHLATGASAPGWSHERTHVAIDRWTGGAAAQRLYTVEETTVEDWHPIRLELDGPRLERARPRERVAAVVLLGIAVALLREGEVGFGHGTTRGLGEVEVTDVAVGGLASLGLAEPGDDWWGWLFELSDGDDLEGLIRGDRALA